MMTVKELRNQIKDIDDDTEVFIRCVNNPTGNIIEARSANKDIYGFFGKKIECVIIEAENE